MRDEKFPELLGHAGYAESRKLLERAEAGLAEASTSLDRVRAGLPALPSVTEQATAWLFGKPAPKTGNSKVTPEDVAEAEKLVAVRTEAVRLATEQVGEQRRAAAGEVLNAKREEYRASVQSVSDALASVIVAVDEEQATFNYAARLANDTGLRNHCPQRTLDARLRERIRHEARAMRSEQVPQIVGTQSAPSFNPIFTQ